MKPIEYWAVLAEMILPVATRDAEAEALTRRLLKTAASALLTIGLSPEVAARLGMSEVLAAEGNKFMAAIMRKVGAIPALAAGKVAAGFAGWYLYAQDDMLILPILCLVYAGVVVNNVRVILQASG